MSSTEMATPTVTEQGRWKGGVAAGLVASAVMGIMLTMQMTPVIQNAIPALYGLSGGAAGWVAHMAHGAVLGVVFAGTVEAIGSGDDATKSAGLGIAYGVVLWIVLAAVVMPIWLGAVGFPGTPPLPNVNPMSLVGHIVYGVVLGVVYPYVRDL
ncbi:MAG: DUF6789 family protein [Halobacteriota archaeon]